MHRRNRIIQALAALTLAVLPLFGVETVISIPGDATAVEQYAAEELGSYLGKIYGMQFKVRKNDPSAPIRIGTADKSSADLGNDGFEIHSDGKTLNIRGGTRRGTGNLFGVYEYLERLGCRFLTKTEEYIPTGKKYELPVLNVREKPSFENRMVISTGRFGVKMRCSERAGNNRKLFGKLGLLSYFRPFSSHTSFFFIDPKKYAKSHPEYFAIHKGRRSFGHKVGQLCLSNPEMTEEFIRNVKAYLKKAELTEGVILKIGPQDDQNYCECARCAEIDKEEGTHGGTLVRFLNRVAEELSRDYPNLMIGGSAYQYYRFPPRKTSYHKNVVIRLCNIECDVSKAFTGYPANEEFLKLLLEWKKRCSKLAVCDYGSTFDYFQLPLPNFDALAERVRKFRDIGGISDIATINAHNGGPAQEFFELRDYLTSRLYWNADADPWKIAEDFCRHYYGKGGKYLLDYIRWYHQHLTSKKADFRLMRQPVNLYDEAFVGRAEQAFRKAYAAAGSDPVFRTRLDRAYTTVQMMRVLLLRRTRPNSPEFKTAVDQLDAARKRFGIRAISETKTSMEDFIREMRFTIKEVPEFCRGKKWYATLPHGWLLWDWGKKVDDPLTASGKAVQVNTWHNAWTVYKKLDLPGCNTPARYDAYVRIRVIPEPGAKPDSPAFSAGVWLSKGNFRGWKIQLKDTSANEYRYIRIAESIPVTETGYVWVAPEKNPEMIRKILVDHFIFVRVDDAQVNK